MMTGHYSALVNVKPTFNTQRRPFVHVKNQKERRANTAAQGGRKRPITATQKAVNFNEDWLNKLANDFEYEETRQTFKRCNKVKSDIRLQTHNEGFQTRSKKLSQYKQAKKSTYHEEEHLRNLAALRTRVQNVGNAQDRAKNFYDPVSNPVRFFRKSEVEAQKVNISDFQKRLESNLANVKRKNDLLA